MFTYIHHVGIACHNLDSKIDFYRDTFGLILVSQEGSPKDGIREAMMQVSGNGRLAASPLGQAATPSYVQLLSQLVQTLPLESFWPNAAKESTTLATRSLILLKP